MILSSTEQQDAKECTFKPKILSTKAAQKIQTILKPSRDLRLQEHLERKHHNIEVKRQELFARQNEDLKFKPQINPSKPHAASTTTLLKKT